MVFVNENTTKEEKEKFAVNRWTIDKEKGAYLVDRGGAGCSNNRHFEFYYNGKSTKFFATQHYGRNENNEDFVTWGIPPLGMPEFPLEEHREIKEMMLEAFRCYGFACDYNERRPRPLIVTAKFGSDLKII
jgi:hypothetical protein